MDRLTKAIVFWTNQILVTKRWWCRGLSRTEESQHLSMERTSSPSHEIQPSPPPLVPVDIRPAAAFDQKPSTARAPRYRRAVAVGPRLQATSNT